MTANSPEVIYLIDTGDGVAWCDDPDPTGGGECDGAVKYVRGDAYEALQAECEALRMALVEARDLVAEWGAYADDYFKEWHGLERDIARLDAVISGEE